MDKDMQDFNKQAMSKRAYDRAGEAIEYGQNILEHKNEEGFVIPGYIPEQIPGYVQKIDDGIKKCCEAKGELEAIRSTLKNPEKNQAIQDEVLKTMTGLESEKKKMLKFPL